jgi:hypothetical protein
MSADILQNTIFLVFDADLSLPALEALCFKPQRVQQKSLSCSSVEGPSTGPSHQRESMGRNLSSLRGIAQMPQAWHRIEVDNSMEHAGGFKYPATHHPLATTAAAAALQSTHHHCQSSPRTPATASIAAIALRAASSEVPLVGEGAVVGRPLDVVPG